MVIQKVFLLLISRPNFPLSSAITIIRFCSCSYESATMAVSSPYRMLFTLSPPILNPSMWLIFLITISVYSEKSTGDKTHPCLTPFAMFTQSLISCPTRTDACWCCSQHSTIQLNKLYADNKSIHLCSLHDMQNITHVLKTGMSASRIQAVCSNFNWINFLRRFIFADELIISLFIAKV